MIMRNILLALVTISICSACSSIKPTRLSNADLTEKELSLIENNSNFSIASIVGGGAYMAEMEKKKIEEEKAEARKNRLKAIEGFSVHSFMDNGQEKLKAIAQNDILFKFDSHELNDNAKGMLNKLASVINETPDTQVKIIGHTDNVGEKEYNLILSRNRAAAVGNHLRAAVVNPENIIEDGKGYSQPIADNKTEEGRTKNRRVEIIISTIE